VLAVPKFDHDVDSLFRRQFRVRASVGFLGIFKAGKDSDRSLHFSYYIGWKLGVISALNQAFAVCSYSQA
jgi:hypothetical protein